MTEKQINFISGIRAAVSLWHFNRCCVLLCFILSFSFICTPKCSSQQNGDFELFKIPVDDDSGRSLLVNVLRPEGRGPFPLVIINHGSPALAKKRSEMIIPTFSRLSKWFVKQGYVVALPLRRGYGVVGDPWNETYGSCQQPDYKKAGAETARDIKTVINSLVRENFIQKQNIIVVGQSAGGWGALALASENPINVSGYINFAGGRGGNQKSSSSSNCSPDALVQAALQFGKNAKQPSLWIYAENDSYFHPALVKQMHQHYISSGGKAILHILPPVGSDGHRAIADEEAFALWLPIILKFIQSLK